jgi:L-cystine uptake protein TcyP (sodium:dicarboxylate symporter family)
MAAQVIGVGTRSRVYAALIALALMFAVAVVVAQAHSIWPATTVRKVKPAMQYSISLKEMQAISTVRHLPKGCRVKYGCQDGTASRHP